MATYKRNKGRLYKRIKVRNKKTGTLYTVWKNMGKTAKQRSIEAKASKRKISGRSSGRTRVSKAASKREKMAQMVHIQDVSKVIPAGTGFVSSGGKIWYKGFKHYGTFNTSAEAKQSTMMTFDRKGTFTGFTTKAQAKSASEYWWQKNKEKAQEKAKAYRAKLALQKTAIAKQKAVAAKTRIDFITGEKLAIETELQRRFDLLGRRRRGPRTAALSKSAKEAWGRKLAESRKHEGEMWFGKITSILGSSQTTSQSNGRRNANRILRELNGVTHRKSATRKKTGR